MLHGLGLCSLLTGLVHASQACAQCGATLRPMQKWEKAACGGQQRLTDVYSVRLCINKDCSARVNRDVNAARNMLQVLLAQARGEERPPHLDRGLSRWQCHVRKGPVFWDKFDVVRHNLVQAKPD